MAYTNQISLPFTVTGGVSTGAGHPYYHPTDTLSGYTNALTRFRFTLSGNAEYVRAPGISNDSLVWDMGDGTTVKGTSALHIYETPGTYTVSLVAYSSGGDAYLSTVTKQLSVGNFIDDVLSLRTDDIVNTINIPAGTKGVVPIKVNRTSSWQSHNAVSGIGYSLNLYASGSDSKQLNLDTYTTDKWNHVDQTWSFFKQVTADNGTTSLSPINNIKTTSENIYFIRETVRGSTTYTRVPSSYMTTVSGISTIFVGTSGHTEFYYGDDTPKYSTDPVFIYTSIDTSQYPEYLNQSLRGSNITDFNFYQQSNLTIPVRVRFNSADKIIFTSSGISDIGLSTHKWQNTEVPFFINFEDTYGQITENYPTLSIYKKPLSALHDHRRVVVPGTPENEQTYTVSLSVLSASSVDTRSMSAHFFKEQDIQLPVDMPGIFRGYFVPLDVGDDISLVGELSANDIPNLPKDTLFGWVGGVKSRHLYRLFFTQLYNINDISGDLQSKDDVKFTTQSLTGSHMRVPINVHPVLDNINDNRVNAITVSHDQIFTYDTYTTLLSTTTLTAVNVSRVTDDVEVLDEAVNLVTLSPNRLNDKSLIPTSISVDSNRNIWLALSGGVMAIQLDPVSGTVLNMVNHNNNFGYDSYTAGARGVTIPLPEGNLNNLIEPGIIETDKQNNVWVGYTNPVSGYIEKYNETGNPLSIKYEFNQGYAPTDMVVDNRDNLWVTTKDSLRALSGLAFESYPGLYGPFLGSGTGKSHSVTATASAEVVGGGIRFRMYGGSPSNIDTFAENQIVEMTGFSTTKGDLNGQYIIDSVSTTTSHFTVKPLVSKLNKLAQSADGITNASVKATIYAPDKVYRFNSSGTKTIEVSGLRNPTLIVPDMHQNLWVAHDVNTLTQINTAGQISDTIKVQSDSFISNYLSAGSYLNTIGAAVSGEGHIGALTVDAYNRLIVVNSFENKVFTIPINNRSLSSVQIMPTTLVSSVSTHDGFIYGTKSAYGDWTGYRWLNKYKNTTGIRRLSGSSTFTVLPSAGIHSISKFNEDFDPAETIKSYRFQPLLIDQTVLFDDFIGTAVGTISSSPTDIGRHIYEKISNFVSNISDVDECNINSLYSICEQYGFNLDNYNYNYPGSLNRLMSLLSIQHGKLWGQRSKYQSDFKDYGTGDAKYALNRGTELDPLTAIVIVGQPIVAMQLFAKEYKLINPMYLNGASSHPDYDSSVGFLSSYPLSAFRPQWGWGLYNNLSGADIKDYYNFFEWNDVTNNIQLEGVIDWDGGVTTLNETVSALSAWTDKDGIVETMIDYELRKGLGLLTTSLSAFTSGIE